MKKFFARLRGGVQAQVSTCDLSDAFYDDFATEESGRYWWWIRAILLDPDEMIVDSGRDELYRLPFTVTDTGITFGEPTAVEIQYVDVAEARAQQVAAVVGGIAQVRGELVAARYESRVESRLNTTEGGVMREYIDKMRAKLGLAANLTDEQVLAAAAAHLEAGETPPATDPATGDPATGDPATGDPATGDPATGDPATGDPATGDPATPAEDGPVSVDAAALAELRAQAAEGAEARRIQREQDEDRVLTTALAAGKFPPSRLEHYRKLLKADPEGTREMIDGLEENVIPLAARGANGGGNNGGDGGSTAQSAELAAWQARHMPEIAERKAALEASGTVRRRVFTDQ